MNFFNREKDKRGDKRGLILTQVIEILIAIAVIVIIIIAAQKLFATYFGKTKELQAKGTVEGIAQKLNSLQEGESISYLLQAPSGWQLVSFDVAHNENKGFTRASKYFNQNIVCVCEKKTCNICQTLKIPLKQNTELANIKIEISDLWLTNMQSHYEISKTSPTDIVELSEEEKISSLAYPLSNTKIDSWLEEKNSPIAGSGQCIIDTSTKTGVPKEIILAVAIHESGWGKSELAQQCKNLFGIKGIGTQGSCERLTKENLNGQEIQIKADFAKYDNFCQSISHFGKKISTSFYYAEAMKYTGDINKMVYAIHGCSGPYAGKPCIYATDPQWADKVIAIMSQIKEADIL